MRELIALRNGFVEIPQAENTKIEPNHAQVVMSTQAELMKLGYILSQDAVARLSETNTRSVIKFHDSILGYLRTMLGADRKYRPFYVNFPEQVMEMSQLELFVNAVLHYWTNGIWEPAQELKTRGVKFENVNFKMLKPVSGDQWLRDIAVNLASFTKPLDDQRVADLVWIATNVPNVEVGYISVKETLCALGAAGINVKLSSPVDVLRIAVKLSGGNIALPNLPKPEKMPSGWRYASRREEAEALRSAEKFKKFTRPQRKYLLSLLESLKTIDVSEMARHLGRWKRLGEVLHPGEYATMFPRAFDAFNQLRNEKVRTFAGQVDLAFQQSADEGMVILKRRPGEFARRLDSLLRKYDTLVLPHFEEVAAKVSSKVVFEMFDHFEGRRKETLRMVMLKGRGAKAQTLEALPALPKKTVDKVQKIVLNTLRTRFAALAPMGKVFLDENLKNIPVPFSMQSSSEGVDTHIRGTRVPFREDAKVIRGFIHWYDKNGIIDIDLAAGFYDEKFNLIEEIAYYNLSSSQLGVCHSGDIRHRHGDCAEYVDVPIKKCEKEGIRYVVFNAYNFNGTSLGSVEGCTFGIMEREHAQSNEIFDAKTVTNAIKVQAKSSAAFPVALDLERKQWIWIDLEHDQGHYANMAADTSTKQQFEALLSGSKLSIYDLLLLHVEARGGKLVPSADEASEKFMEADFQKNYTKLTPFLAV